MTLIWRTVLLPMLFHLYEVKAVDCYSCVNCHPDSWKNTASVAKNCEYCTTNVILVNNTPNLVLRGCVPFCNHAVKLHDGNGTKTRCCQTHLCNGAPRIKQNSCFLLLLLAHLLLIVRLVTK
ncbi:hypothetical protein FGIG_08044 [Fasciola gigantica]|uniref:UPAR/Ly6 domain-containing protein n=1 Tax=Fasciola gigantica TaxID=46835 RepID=A0A504Z1D6_FASGI|nr:hypothetical protein FGIG_08044 [Fasciola gigantica]